MAIYRTSSISFDIISCHWPCVWILAMNILRKNMFLALFSTLLLTLIRTLDDCMFEAYVTHFCSKIIF
jgi:hypothetical protein